VVTLQPTLTLRRRLFVAVLGLVLAGGICAAVLAIGSPTRGPETAGQPSVIPHLVPDVGELHSGSQSTSSAPRTSVHPGIRLIPSAGGPVRVYGGAPSASTLLPAGKG
jgi:hypothetical protein